MTTIAWDGKTLAGDKQVTTGGTPTRTTKVFKVKSAHGLYLAGFSGDLADGQAFIRYVEKGFKGELPKFNCINAMVIMSDGRVLTYHDMNVGPADMGVLENWAMGSGCDYALGAMGFGATAEEAIQVAMKLDIDTGLGIDTVSFS